MRTYRAAIMLSSLALASVSSASVYTFNLGSFGPFDNTTGHTANFAVNADGPIRGYYVSGDWTRATGTSAPSLLRTRISDGTTTWALANIGGHTTSTTTNWQFGQFTSNYNNGTFNAVTTPQGEMRTNIFSGNANANYSLTFFSGSATMTGSMSNTSVSLLTDVVAPFVGQLNANQVYRRASSLTALAAAGNYQYQAYNFVAPTSGTYMIAGKWLLSSTATYDGHMSLYQGTFDPNNALTNLVGIDDDALPVPPGTSAFNSSAMWLNLTGGQSYTIVATQFTAGAASNQHSVYVAGPVPEPGTIAVLGLGAAALLRRRKKSK